MIWKISPLVKFEILWVYINTLTADHMYHVPDIENLLFPNQTILSKKQKTLSQFSGPFLEFLANLKHLQRKEGRHS